MLAIILENLDGIILGIDIGKKLRSLDGSFGGSNYGQLESVLIGESMGYTDGKVLDCDEGITLGSTYIKVLGTILGNVDVIIHGLNVGTDLVSLD